MTAPDDARANIQAFLDTYQHGLGDVIACIDGHELRWRDVAMVLWEERPRVPKLKERWVASTSDATEYVCECTEPDARGDYAWSYVQDGKRRFLIGSTNGLAPAVLA